MKTKLLLLTLVFFSTAAFAQSTFYTIYGKVVDGVTKTAMPGASVFAQNSTFGTATDAEGNFTIKLPNGGYDLAVTYTGYETETKRISSSDNDSKVIIELKQKDRALEVVSVVSSNEVKDGWEKYGSFFIENFIGKTSFSQNCTLVDHDSLHFYFSKKRNRLKVLSSTPLEIINNSLGYKIKYALDSFTHEYGTQVSTYSGSPLFEEMHATNTDQQKLWQQNRALAYSGSILHFMRSIYNKHLKEEGYEIQFIVNKNTNAEAAIIPKDQYGAINYNNTDSTLIVEFSPNQPDMAVLYKKEKPDSGYSTQNEDTPKDFQLSVLTINPSQTIAIEQNGYYYDQNDITINGYWTWEKVGDMLPYDYKP